MLKPPDLLSEISRNLITTEVFFQPAILDWYKKHQRALPWRHSPEPYKVWLSEIILQQTRVDQGLPYYERFLAAYPDLESFSNASEDELLLLWQGLGYYSRARNMKFAAAQVMNEYGGRFPVTSTELKKLKGIGDYTAAAISSSCFNEPDAVVDGNVYRVLSRYFGIDLPVNSSQGKKFFAILAQGLLPVADAGIYNQAIMDFGALQCKPVPVCSTCVLNLRCVAFADKRVKELPVKTGKMVPRLRYFDYLVISLNENLMLVKRGAGDIWQGLFDFPLVESAAASEGFPDPEALSVWLGKNQYTLKSGMKVYKHVLSHQVIYARFWEITLQNDAVLPVEGLIPVAPEKLSDFGMPRLALRYLESTLNEQS